MFLPSLKFKCCQERIGCTSCLLEQDCVWCQDTQVIHQTSPTVGPINIWNVTRNPTNGMWSIVVTCLCLYHLTSILHNHWWEFWWRNTDGILLSIHSLGRWMLNSSYDLNFHFFKLHTQQLCTLHIPISQKKVIYTYSGKTIWFITTSQTHC